MGEEGKAENEGQVNHAEGMGLHGEDSAIERPDDKGNVENTDDHGEFPTHVPHPWLLTTGLLGWAFSLRDRECLNPEGHFDK
jgi:hypothetical protein